MIAFESAVEAIIHGDLVTLGQLLRERPEFIRERSAREHRATLLHYVGANGVEHERQKTPANAVAVAKTLLDAGAEVDAMADMYGGSTTLELVATSIHPLAAGVQNELLELLLERGAVMDARASIVNACLANGRGRAAEFLAERGASLDLEGAAGVGRLELVESLFPDASGEQRRSGFAWACQFGRVRVVASFLRNGMDVSARLRHHGQTGLHWAALNAQLAVVRLLLEHHAPVDVRDEAFGGTPLGWACHGRDHPSPEADPAKFDEVIATLRSTGATGS